MTIQELQNKMIAAMKAHNKVEKEVISGIITTTKNMAINKGCKDNISEEIVAAAILKERKTSIEMLDNCPADRQDLLDEYKLRADIIENFTPKMMDESEIKSTINQLAREQDIELTKNNRGVLMKALMPKIKGKADGKLVNQIVGEMLR